jgi:hypothetical protein
MDETPDAPQDVRPDVVDPPLTLVRHKSVPPSRKGQKGAGGRPRGARNKVTLQIREAAARLFDDPVYWRKLRSDLRKRKLHPQMEVTLLAYAYGRPVDRIEVGRVGDFSKLSDDELLAQFESTIKSLRAERPGGGEKKSLSPSAPPTG